MRAKCVHPSTARGHEPASSSARADRSVDLHTRSISSTTDRAFGNQLDAWASGLGDWGECEADDDDDFDEPSAWRDSMALGDCDA